MSLTTNQRRRIWADVMRDLSRRNEPIAIGKADLRAAIDALDGWMDANAAAVNQALPVAARTGLTAAQKAELLSVVLLKRFAGGDE